MSQIFDPILPVQAITPPLALRESGDPEHFVERAESNLTDMADFADDLNEDFIPKINAMGAYIYDAAGQASLDAATAAQSAADAAQSAANAALSATVAGESETAAVGGAAAASRSAEAAREAEEAVSQMYGGLTDGATHLPTPGTPAARDANGCSQFGDAVNPQDAVNLRTLSAALGGVGQSLFFAGQMMPYYGPLDPTGKHPLAGGVVRSDWRVCDGTGGTPDMRNRFPMGAGAATEAGTTGGSATHTHTVTATVNNTSVTPAGTLSATAVTMNGSTGSASVTPSGAVGATTLTLSQIPAHGHDIPLALALLNFAASGNESYVALGGGPSRVRATDSGGNGSHTHSFTGTASPHAHAVSLSSTAHGHTFTGTATNHKHTAAAAASEAGSLPPHLALNFIMYIGG